MSYLLFLLFLVMELHSTIFISITFQYKTNTDYYKTNIKLVYKSMTHFPLTFYYTYFLKLVSDQNWTCIDGQRVCWMNYVNQTEWIWISLAIRKTKIYLCDKIKKKSRKIDKWIQIAMRKTTNAITGFKPQISPTLVWKPIAVLRNIIWIYNMTPYINLIWLESQRPPWSHLCPPHNNIWTLLSFTFDSVSFMKARLFFGVQSNPYPTFTLIDSIIILDQIFKIYI